MGLRRTKEMVDWDVVKAFRARSLNPMQLHSMGSAEQRAFQHKL
ncbi:MAG: hypothetical protein ACLTK0_02080 [Anaerovoracaceae bacterium]